MTRDDILRMAREAGIGPLTIAALEHREGRLERFAALVAAAEREACAQVCDLEAAKWPYPSHANAAVTVAVAAIRARAAHAQNPL